MMERLSLQLAPLCHQLLLWYKKSAPIISERFQIKMSRFFLLLEKLAGGGAYFVRGNRPIVSRSKVRDINGLLS